MNRKIAAVLPILAGICFLVSSVLKKEIIYVVLGLLWIMIGIKIIKK